MTAREAEQVGLDPNMNRALAEMERCGTKAEAQLAVTVRGILVSLAAKDAEIARLRADNAALLRAWHEAYDHNNFRPGEDIAGTAHPGAAMLEEMKKGKETIRALAGALDRTATIHTPDGPCWCIVPMRSETVLHDDACEPKRHAMRLAREMGWRP